MFSLGKSLKIFIKKGQCNLVKSVTVETTHIHETNDTWNKNTHIHEKKTHIHEFQPFNKKTREVSKPMSGGVSGASEQI